MFNFQRNHRFVFQNTTLEYSDSRGSFSKRGEMPRDLEEITPMTESLIFAETKRLNLGYQLELECHMQDYLNASILIYRHWFNLF